MVAPEKTSVLVPDILKAMDQGCHYDYRIAFTGYGTNDLEYREELRISILWGDDKSRFVCYITEPYGLIRTLRSHNPKVNKGYKDYTVTEECRSVAKAYEEILGAKKTL